MNSRIPKKKRDDSVYGSRHEEKSVYEQNVHLKTVQHSCIMKENVISRYWKVGKVMRVNCTARYTDFVLKKNELMVALPPQHSQLRGLLEPCYAFGLVRSEELVDMVCQKDKFECMECGDLSLGRFGQGVTLGLNADLLLEYSRKNRYRNPSLIIFKIIKGRCRQLPSRLDANGQFFEPTDNFESQMLAPPSCGREQDLRERIAHSQIFLYEYDSEMKPMKNPRHCVPIAVINYNRDESVPPRRSSASTQGTWSTGRPSRSRTDPTRTQKQSQRRHDNDIQMVSNEAGSSISRSKQCNSVSRELQTEHSHVKKAVANNGGSCSSDASVSRAKHNESVPETKHRKIVSGHPQTILDINSDDNVWSFAASIASVPIVSRLKAETSVSRAKTKPGKRSSESEPDKGVSRSQHEEGGIKQICDSNDVSKTANSNSDSEGSDDENGPSDFIDIGDMSDQSDTDVNIHDCNAKFSDDDSKSTVSPFSNGYHSGDAHNSDTESIGFPIRDESAEMHNYNSDSTEVSDLTSSEDEGELPDRRPQLPKKLSPPETATPKKLSPFGTATPKKPSLPGTATTKKLSQSGTATPKKLSPPGTAIPKKLTPTNTATPKKLTPPGIATPKKLSPPVTATPKKLSKTPKNLSPPGAVTSTKVPKKLSPPKSVTHPPGKEKRKVSSPAPRSIKQRRIEAEAKRNRRLGDESDEENVEVDTMQEVNEEDNRMQKVNEEDDRMQEVNEADNRMQEDTRVQEVNEDDTRVQEVNEADNRMQEVTEEDDRMQEVNEEDDRMQEVNEADTRVQEVNEADNRMQEDNRVQEVNEEDDLIQNLNRMLMDAENKVNKQLQEIHDRKSSESHGSSISSKGPSVHSTPSEPDGKSHDLSDSHASSSVHRSDKCSIPSENPDDTSAVPSESLSSSSIRVNTNVPLCNSETTSQEPFNESDLVDYSVLSENAKARLTYGFEVRAIKLPNSSSNGVIYEAAHSSGNNNQPSASKTPRSSKTTSKSNTTRGPSKKFASKKSTGKKGSSEKSTSAGKKGSKPSTSRRTKKTIRAKKAADGLAQCRKSGRETNHKKAKTATSSSSITDFRKTSPAKAPETPSTSVRESTAAAEGRETTASVTVANPSKSSNGQTEEEIPSTSPDAQVPKPKGESVSEGWTGPKSYKKQWIKIYNEQVPHDSNTVPMVSALESQQSPNEQESKGLNADNTSGGNSELQNGLSEQANDAELEMPVSSTKRPRRTSTPRFSVLFPNPHENPVLSRERLEHSPNNDGTASPCYSDIYSDISSDSQTPRDSDLVPLFIDTVRTLIPSMPPDFNSASHVQFGASAHLEDSPLLGNATSSPMPQVAPLPQASPHDSATRSQFSPMVEVPPPGNVGSSSDALHPQATPSTPTSPVLVPSVHPDVINVQSAQHGLFVISEAAMAAVKETVTKLKLIREKTENQCAATASPSIPNSLTDNDHEVSTSSELQPPLPPDPLPIQPPLPMEIEPLSGQLPTVPHVASLSDQPPLPDGPPPTRPRLPSVNQDVNRIVVKMEIDLDSSGGLVIDYGHRSKTVTPHSSVTDIPRIHHLEEEEAEHPRQPSDNNSYDNRRHGFVKEEAEDSTYMDYGQNPHPVADAPERPHLESFERVHPRPRNNIQFDDPRLGSHETGRVQEMIQHTEDRVRAARAELERRNGLRRQQYHRERSPIRPHHDPPFHDDSHYRPSYNARYLNSPRIPPVDLPPRDNNSFYRDGQFDGRPRRPDHRDRGFSYRTFNGPHDNRRRDGW